MAQVIQFEGQTHEFPDDFSSADISKALASVKPAAAFDKPALPEAERIDVSPEAATAQTNSALLSPTSHPVDKILSLLTGAGGNIMESPALPTAPMMMLGKLFGLSLPKDPVSQLQEKVSSNEPYANMLGMLAPLLIGAKGGGVKAASEAGPILGDVAKEAGTASMEEIPVLGKILKRVRGVVADNAATKAEAPEAFLTPSNVIEAEANPAAGEALKSFEERQNTQSTEAGKLATKESLQKAPAALERSQKNIDTLKQQVLPILKKYDAQKLNYSDLPEDPEVAKTIDDLVRRGQQSTVDSVLSQFKSTISKVGESISPSEMDAQKTAFGDNAFTERGIKNTNGAKLWDALRRAASKRTQSVMSPEDSSQVKMLDNMMSKEFERQKILKPMSKKVQKAQSAEDIINEFMGLKK